MFGRPGRLTLFARQYKEHGATVEDLDKLLKSSIRPNARSGGFHKVREMRGLPRLFPDG